MAECATPHHVKIAKAVEGMTKTYAFVFGPEPEGGYTVTCPTLPGLVTYGETLSEAEAMARDVMEGLIEIMIEQGEEIPDSDSPAATSRFDRLAHSLRNEDKAEPIFK